MTALETEPARPVAPVMPAWGGACVDGIVPALLGDRAGSGWLPAAAREARQVVLLVLDGLGWTALEARRAHLPVLGAMAGGPVTTVVPSTTASALTSIATGAPPARHGILGYRFRVGGQELQVLRWQGVKKGESPDPARVQPLAPFGGRRIPVVTKHEFLETGFTAAHLRGTSFLGWRTPAVLVEQVKIGLATGSDLVYAYYHGIDKVAHGHGLHDGMFHAELAFADRLVGDLLAAVGPGVAVLVTADHGQVHVDPEGAVPIAPAVLRLASHVAGEGRFRTFHARPGAAGELHAAAVAAHGMQAWVFRRDELFDGGWFGEGASAEIRGRMGDVVLAAQGAVAFLDPALPKEAQMRSHHGSLTPDEVLVPLLAACGG